MSFVVGVACVEDDVANDVIVPGVFVMCAEDVVVVKGEVVGEVDAVIEPAISISFEEDVVAVEDEVVVEVDCGVEEVFLGDGHSGANLPGSSPISRLGLVELETRALSEIRNSGLDADMEDFPTRSAWKAMPVESSTNGAQRGARFDEKEQGTSFGEVGVSRGNDGGGLWGRSEALRGGGRGGDFRSGAYEEIAVESFLRAMEDERISGEVRRKGPKNLEEALEFAVRLEERASSQIDGVDFGSTSSVRGVVVRKSWAEMCEEEERRGAATGGDVTGVRSKKAHDACMYQERQQTKERRLQRAGRIKTMQNAGYKEKN